MNAFKFRILTKLVKSKLKNCLIIFLFMSKIMYKIPNNFDNLYQIENVQIIFVGS